MAEPLSDVDSNTLDLTPGSTRKPSPSSFEEGTTVDERLGHVANLSTPSDVASAPIVTEINAQTFKGVDGQASHDAKSQNNHHYSTAQMSGLSFNHRPNKSQGMKPSYRISLFTGHDHPGGFGFEPFTRTVYRVGRGVSSNTEATGSQGEMTKSQLENVKECISEASIVVQSLYVPFNQEVQRAPQQEYINQVQRYHRSLIDTVASQYGDPKTPGQTFEVCTDVNLSEKSKVDERPQYFFDDDCPNLDQRELRDYSAETLDKSEQARALMAQEISSGNYRDVADYIAKRYDPKDDTMPLVLAHDVLQEMHQALA